MELVLAILDELDAGALACVVGLVDELLGHVEGTGVLDELAHLDLVHRAERVHDGVEDDLRHAGALEVVAVGRVEVRGLEVVEHLLLDEGLLAGHRDQAHSAGSWLPDEVDVRGAVHDRRDHGGASVDVLVLEVLLEHLEVAPAVHGAEDHLVVLEEPRLRASLEHVCELHLLEHDDPDVGVALVLLGGVDVDGDHMTVLVVAAHRDAASRLRRVDVWLPAVDEVDLLARELLQKDAVAIAHCPCPEDCVVELAIRVCHD